MRTVAAGDALLDPSVTRRVVEDFVRRNARVQAVVYAYESGIVRPG